MIKSDLANFFRLQNSNNKREFLDKIPQSQSCNTDIVSTKVWGTLTQKQHHKLQEAWIRGGVENHTDKRVILKTAIDVAKVCSAICNGTLGSGIHNHILSQIGNAGVALEYFLLDSLLRRNKKKGDNIHFEKGPLEFDSNQIDLLSKYMGIKFGIQLTTTDSTRINTKERQMKRVSNQISQGNGQINIKNFSISQIPDLPALIVVNSYTSRELNKGVASRTNVLKTAYLDWKKEGYSYGGPSQYLEQEIQDELTLITNSYPEIVDGFFEFVRSGKLNKPRNYIVKYNSMGMIYISYDSENSEYAAKFHKNTQQGNEFIYSVKFYITTKFLDKIKTTG